MSESVPSDLPGEWRRHADRVDQAQHGKPERRSRSGSTDNSQEPGRVGWGGGEVRSTDEAE